MQKGTGWIKLHRQIMANRMWRYDGTAMYLFVSLLMLVDKNTGSYTTGRYALSTLIGIKPVTTYKALQRLSKAGMVTLSSNNKYTTINILNWKTYQGVGNSPDNNQVTTKEQPSITKQEVRLKNGENTNVLAYGKPEINEMFDYWETTTGIAISARIKQNRNACNNLLKKHGKEKLQQLIKGVALAQGEKYAPTIADFSQLQAKLSELLIWGRKQTKSKGVVIE